MYLTSRNILFDEVLVKDDWCAEAGLFQAFVQLWQEVFLYVDKRPTFREALSNVEDGISPKRSLQERVLVTNQIENQRCELAKLAADDVFWHLVDKDGYELETGGAHTTSIVL